ncbi:MAG: multiple antibiotic resistance protein [Paraburkholderia sp.]|jgi:multiple antibiotic resistance protein|uniref:MarC family protein n=1 Tax=Paraburkholderia sp. TaxID=1926495 RepID=UPI002AFFAE8F|nr:MarC family protein [Paraburkholderia sp.]MEA3083330.1 multiple antibiotic resistance protein [Paraburkholderia sp.]
MLNAPANSPEHRKAHAADQQRTDITFFPLTMPITAGAGSMAVTVAMAANLRQDAHDNYIVSHLSPVAGICAVFIIVGICYNVADVIFRKLGETGTSVVTRLAAFILLAISVNVVWSGARSLILTLH